MKHSPSLQRRAIVRPYETGHPQVLGGFIWPDQYNQELLPDTPCRHTTDQTLLKGLSYHAKRVPKVFIWNHFLSSVVTVVMHALALQIEVNG